jgi:hypothetical protein
VRTHPAARSLGYLVFLLVSALVAALLAWVGSGAALRWAGEAGARALLWACGVGFAASVVSGLPLTAARRGSEGVKLVLLSMLLRLSVVAVGGFLAVRLLELDPRPFLLSLAASYLTLLVVDTAYALRTLRSL